jgi:putative endonuclease
LKIPAFVGMSMLSMWYVYILECADKSLYTGITNDLKRRIDEHNNSKLGAKYTRGRRPVKLVYSKRTKDKIGALREEYRLKKLSRQEKIKLYKKK